MVYWCFPFFDINVTLILLEVILRFFDTIFCLTMQTMHAHIRRKKYISNPPAVSEHTFSICLQFLAQIWEQWDHVSLNSHKFLFYFAFMKRWLTTFTHKFSTVQDVNASVLVSLHAVVLAALWGLCSGFTWVLNQRLYLNAKVSCGSRDRETQTENQPARQLDGEICNFSHRCAAGCSCSSVKTNRWGAMIHETRSLFSADSRNGTEQIVFVMRA